MTGPAAAIRPQQPAPQTVARATEIASMMLARQPGHRRADPQAAAAFGRALAVTSPRTPHGQLLTAALRPRPFAERGDAERAAYWLARRGETPTAGAVAARLEALRTRREGAERRKTRAGQLAARDAAKAAAHVDQVITTTGAGPTWVELGNAMDWPREFKNAVITRLVRTGWLETGTAPRSMRPGPAYTERRSSGPPGASPQAGAGTGPRTGPGPGTAREDRPLSTRKVP